MRMIMKSHAQCRSAFPSKHVTETTPEAEDDNQTQVLDRLCLVLGLLTNFVQVSDVTKDLIRTIREAFRFGVLFTRLIFDIRPRPQLHGEARLYTNVPVSTACQRPQLSRSGIHPAKQRE